MRPHPRAKDERAETECNSPTRDGHDGAAGAPGLVGELYISYHLTKAVRPNILSSVTDKTVNESVCACFEHDNPRAKQLSLRGGEALHLRRHGVREATEAALRHLAPRDSAATAQRLRGRGTARQRE